MRSESRQFLQVNLGEILRLNPGCANLPEPTWLGIDASLKRDGGSCSEDFSAFVVAFNWVKKCLKESAGIIDRTQQFHSLYQRQS